MDGCETIALVWRGDATCEWRNALRFSALQVSICGVSRRAAEKRSAFRHSHVADRFVRYGLRRGAAYAGSS